MSKSLYVSAIEPASGKSLVVLGIAELIYRRVTKIGIFRPVVHGDTVDNDIELIRTLYTIPQPYESLYALTYEEALTLYSEGKEQEVLKRILAKFKQLEEQCDFVICEGTDFTGVSSALEFNFNARVASHLGCPVLLTGSGHDKKLDTMFDEVRTAQRVFRDEHCSIIASVINRVPLDLLQDTKQKLLEEWNNSEPIFVIPERPILGAPTIGEIAKGLNATVLYSDSDKLMQPAIRLKTAAMRLPNFLERLEEGSLVITPGDRADIILGCVAIAFSDSFPKIAGMVLTGGIQPAESVQRLIDSFPRPPVPILFVPTDTYKTSQNLNQIHAVIGPENHRKIITALGVFEDNIDIEFLAQRIEIVRSTTVTPLMFEYELIKHARNHQQHIVLPEGIEDRILKASEILLRRKVAQLTLLGSDEKIREKIHTLGLQLEGIRIIDPETSPLRARFAGLFTDIRKHKGMTVEVAMDMMVDVNYFGTMMVHQGMADGMVSGAIHTTAHTIRPAFQIIKTQENCTTASSAFFMCLADRVLIYADCAINPNPNAQQLADIAIASADTAAMFDIEPRVAMLSYSTGQSGTGEDVESVKEATKIARSARPDLKIEGPIQYDAAIDSSVANTKLPESDVAGQATVFIFPDLNTGNNTYKAVQRSANALAVGPVMQGLRKPVNDLSRGCTIPDIVNTVAITAVQAHMMKQNK